jgi:hypothetical protein
MANGLMLSRSEQMDRLLLAIAGPRTQQQLSDCFSTFNMTLLLTRPTAGFAIAMCACAMMGESVAHGIAAFSSERIVLNWRPPVSRIDGTPLSAGEIDGYIVTVNGTAMYGLVPSHASSVSVNARSVGQYCFRIATRDTNGDVGPYSEPDCWSVSLQPTDPRDGAAPP